MRMQCATFLLSTPANEAISLDRSASVKRGVKLASSSLPLYEHQRSASFLAASYRNETDELVIYCRHRLFWFFFSCVSCSDHRAKGQDILVQW